MMTSDNLISRTITSLRFPLIAGIVFMHFNLALNPFSLHGVDYGTHNPNWYYMLLNIFSYALPSIGVPLFFFMSGFLFFYRTEFNVSVYKRKLKTRVRTLLIPFILWNIIAFLNMAWRLLPFFSFLFPNADNIEKHFSLIRWFNTFFYNNRYNGVLVSPMDDSVDLQTIIPAPMDVPMWYVRDLMLMVLLSPVVYWLIRKFGWWYIVLAGIVWCFVLFPLETFYFNFFFAALFYFSWGAYFSIKKQSFITFMRKFKFMPLVYFPVVIIDVLLKEISWGFYVHEIGIVLGVVSAIVIASYMLEKGIVRVNKTLADSSFFIFALHLLIMGDIAKVVFVAFHLSDTTAVMLAFYLMVPVITIIICLALYLLLRKYSPKLCGLLTGGR